MRRTPTIIISLAIVSSNSPISGIQSGIRSIGNLVYACPPTVKAAPVASMRLIGSTWENDAQLSSPSAYNQVAGM
eukprot:m.130024 g.130024  ORF g.130024 m.130024 type:complete len:75 (+) comp13696_c0_seq1:3285-3509(+)